MGGEGALLRYVSSWHKLHTQPALNGALPLCSNCLVQMQTHLRSSFVKLGTAGGVPGTQRDDQGPPRVCLGPRGMPRDRRGCTWDEAEAQHGDHVEGGDVEDLGRLVRPYGAAQAAVPRHLAQRREWGSRVERGGNDWRAERGRSTGCRPTAPGASGRRKRAQARGRQGGDENTERWYGWNHKQSKGA